jgi:hypothetical protein
MACAYSALHAPGTPSPRLIGPLHTPENAAKRHWTAQELRASVISATFPTRARRHPPSARAARSSPGTPSCARALPVRIESSCVTLSANRGCRARTRRPCPPELLEIEAIPVDSDRVSEPPRLLERCSAALSHISASPFDHSVSATVETGAGEVTVAVSRRTRMPEHGELLGRSPARLVWYARPLTGALARVFGRAEADDDHSHPERGAAASTQRAAKFSHSTGTQKPREIPNGRASIQRFGYTTTTCALSRYGKSARQLMRIYPALSVRLETPASFPRPRMPLAVNSLPSGAGTAAAP